MKPRVFYIVNLDRRRITVLAAAFSLITISAFSTGYFLAKENERPVYSRADTQNRPVYSREEAAPVSGALVYHKSSSWAKQHDLDFDDIQESALLNEPFQENEEENDDESKTKSTSSPGKEKTAKSRPLSSLAVANVKPVENKPVVREKEQSQPKKAPVKKEKKKEVEKKAQETSKKPAPIYKKEKTKPSVVLDAAPEKKAAVKKTPAKVYTLQLGAFTSRSAATRMADQIRKTGLAPYVLKSGKYHVVRVGRANKRAELYGPEEKLRQEKYAPITVEVGD